MAEDYLERHGVQRRKSIRSVGEYFERQEQREAERERQIRETNSWGKRLGRQISEAVDRLEEAWLV